MTADDVESFRRCISSGGVALFPADTVYGLADRPWTRATAVERLYRLKGRPPQRPAAVMFFALELALAALAASCRTGRAPRSSGCCPARSRWCCRIRLAAIRWRVAPSRRSWACGCRSLEGALAPLAAVRMAGAAVERQPLRAAPTSVASRTPSRSIRAGVDVVLDGGELPGTPSTVVDLSRFHEDGSFDVLREGAVPAVELAERLSSGQ